MEQLLTVETRTLASLCESLHESDARVVSDYSVAEPRIAYAHEATHGWERFLVEKMRYR